MKLELAIRTTPIMLDTKVSRVILAIQTKANTRTTLELFPVKFPPEPASGVPALRTDPELTVSKGAVESVAAA